MSDDQQLAEAFSIDADGVEVFDLDAVVPPTRKIRIRGNIYLVPGEVEIPTMLKFLRFEESDETVTNEQQAQRLGEVSDAIVALLREHNTDVPDLQLGPRSIPLLITHLMGGRSATERVIETLQGGALAEIEDTLRDVRARFEQQGVEFPDEGNDDDAPLGQDGSAKRSSRPSSASPRSTTGRRSGGAARATGRSTSTSKQRAET